MQSEPSKQLGSILGRYPTVASLLGDDFLQKQCSEEPKSYILKWLAEEGCSSKKLQFLDSLENKLGQLTAFPGFSNLRRVLEAPDWDAYMERQTEVNMAARFALTGLLREIGPALHHRQGAADLLLSFQEQSIYCEVTSLRTPQWNNVTAAELTRARKQRPWVTQNQVEQQKQIKAVRRHLLKETLHQLPEDCPGILAVEASRPILFYPSSMEELAPKLFGKRHQLILIMLWVLTDSRTLQTGQLVIGPPFIFPNPQSRFKHLAGPLLRYLEQHRREIQGFLPFGLGL